MVDSAFYLVTRAIIVRAGLLGKRYTTQDGRFILDNKDLSRIRFTPDEYINGLSGVEKITKEQAQILISRNGYSLVDNGLNGGEETSEAEVTDDSLLPPTDGTEATDEQAETEESTDAATVSESENDDNEPNNEGGVDNE